ncbi:MAG: glycogen-binding domain-containing protein [Elusimicrobia bacterium]|nr:glycogen-binding domain-containing protein [Elusimicrobiota bacterium]
MAIKKSKSFWAIVIMINASVVLISGYMLYMRLDTHFSPQVKEIYPTPVPALEFTSEDISIQTAEKEDDSGNPSLIENAQKDFGETSDKATTRHSDSATAQKTKNPEKIKAIKTVFKYKPPAGVVSGSYAHQTTKNLKAKSVSVSGSFTKWENIKMAKKNGIWQADIWILPGSYLFHYTVDGEKVLDSSKPKASIGESVIDVNN